jgi:long-subunit fatty acid transport protein
MKYPLRVALGLAWDVTDRNLLGFGLTWLNWGEYRMSVDYENEIANVLEDWTRNPAKWENTIRIHAGYERVLTEKWVARCGLVYDQAPEPTEYRTLTGGQVVDVWLITAGAGVDLGDMNIDFGYIHTYGPAVEGYIPGAEYSMRLHEFFIGAVKNF